jgi:hypothetical protein
MDHIQDPTLRPLHVLFTDHFMQGIFKHMRGEGEVERTDEDEDPEDALGEGTFSLSNPRIWGTTEGRRLFELELTDRLFYHQMEQGVSLEKS